MSQSHILFLFFIIGVFLTIPIYHICCFIFTVFEQGLNYALSKSIIRYLIQPNKKFVNILCNSFVNEPNSWIITKDTFCLEDTNISFYINDGLNGLSIDNNDIEITLSDREKMKLWHYIYKFKEEYENKWLLDKVDNSIDPLEDEFENLDEEIKRARL